MLLRLPRNDSGVRGLQFIIQSTVKVNISIVSISVIFLVFNSFLFPILVLLYTCNYPPTLISLVQFQQDPANLDARVENFLKMLESTLYEMSDAEFKVRCASLSTYLLFDLALLHIMFQS